jgi:predicted lipoprotein with Yx(FWY)xxD motif
MRISRRISAPRRALSSLRCFRRRLSSVRSIVAPAAAIAAAMALISACGSSPASKSSQSTSQSPAGAAVASVSTKKVPGYGTALVTTNGSPLYLLTADPSGGSSCSGACTKQWPPLTVTGKPTAGTGVSASLLSSFKRSDGTEQVLYAGHALYTHPGLSASAVAGTAADGGIWYLVSPSGKPIKTTNGGGY